MVSPLVWEACALVSVVARCPAWVCAAVGASDCVSDYVSDCGSHCVSDCVTGYVFDHVSGYVFDPEADCVAVWNAGQLV